MATGWLGWAPQIAWETPIIEILMAWDAKLHFLKMTTPGGAAPAPAASDKRGNGRDLRVELRAAAMNRKMS